MNQRRCPYCGVESPSDASRCTHCSTILVDTPTIVIPEFFNTVTSALANKYELVAEIGQGGNASVYQAIQKNLDRKVALKVLLPHLVSDQDYLERFHLEARAIAKLRHPHIVTIYDEGCENGVHFMAMEFLDGKDLHHVVKERGRLSVTDAIGVARCIAGALDYAHSYGIVHRDVKSSNIIMTNSRTAVLTDFGIAQANYSTMHTKVGSVMGTPEFMSPEQAAGKKVDSRSDIYSLGVVLYHTLSGKYPFRADSPLNTIHKIVFDTPVPIGKLVKLPAPVEQAIDRCLEKNPEKRIQNGKELIELLSVKSAPTSVPVAEAPRPRPKPRPRNFRRRAMGLVMAGIALCLLTAGYLILQRSSSSDMTAQAIAAVQPPESGFIKVPDVTGLTREEASGILQKGGLQVGGVRVVAVSPQEINGRVEIQRPGAGSAARPGTPVYLLIGECPDRSVSSVALNARGNAVTYRPLAVNPFDGFAPPIGLGILEFPGAGGKETDIAENLYEALKSANQSFRIYPYSTIKAEQFSLGLESLKPTSKDVLGAFEKELSVDFVVTGTMSDDSGTRFTLQLIRCAGGITVFSQEFKNTPTSSAVNDAVLFLLKQVAPTYADQQATASR